MDAMMDVWINNKDEKWIKVIEKRGGENERGGPWDGGSRREKNEKDKSEGDWWNENGGRRNGGKQISNEVWEIGVRGENRREPETEKKEMTYK